MKPERYRRMNQVLIEREDFVGNVLAVFVLHGESSLLFLALPAFSYGTAWGLLVRLKLSIGWDSRAE